MCFRPTVSSRDYLFTESDFLFTKTARRWPKNRSVTGSICKRILATWRLDGGVFPSGCIHNVIRSPSDYLFTKPDFLFTKNARRRPKNRSITGPMPESVPRHVVMVSRSFGCISQPFGTIPDLLFTGSDFLFTRPKQAPPELWVIRSVQEWSLAAL